MPSQFHVWLALSPHGFGHATMSAPLVAELRRRCPTMKLTIQTALARSFLETRYERFEYVGDVSDIGFRMKSAVSVDLEASAAFYEGLHADFDARVAREAQRLAAARPDLVLANVPYVTVAAASLAGIPVVAYSSINWADMVAHYLGDRPGFPAIVAQMRASYELAAAFMRPTPAQPMSLRNVHDIGPVARCGQGRRKEVVRHLGLDCETRLGLIAFGGIDHRLPLDRWPELPGWHWLSSMAQTPQRPDMSPWEAAGAPFSDLTPSVDVLVTKPGYGTFTEAALSGVPVLYEPRPDWPESAPLEEWLDRHTRCLAVKAEELASPRLPELLHELFAKSAKVVAEPTGIVEGADLLETLLRPIGIGCERS